MRLPGGSRIVHLSEGRDRRTGPAPNKVYPDRAEVGRCVNGGRRGLNGATTIEAMTLLRSNIHPPMASAIGKRLPGPPGAVTSTTVIATTAPAARLIP